MTMLNIHDALMRCCGVIGGDGFDEPVSTGGGWRCSANRDIEERLDYLIKQSENNNRSCALIFLSENQYSAMRLAEEKGFKKVHSFYNPNSGNMVHIYVHTLYSTEEEWKEDQSYDDQDEDWEDEDEE